MRVFMGVYACLSKRRVYSMMPLPQLDSVLCWLWFQGKMFLCKPLCLTAHGPSSAVYLSAHYVQALFCSLPIIQMITLLNSHSAPSQLMDHSLLRKIFMPLAFFPH